MRRADVAAVCGATFVVHLPSFFRTITSANEGLYAVVAREVVSGHLPYLTAWEAKPPLFFWVIAIAMRIFGNSFFSLHLLSLVAAIVTALSVLAIGNCFEIDARPIGLLGGVLCAALFGSDNGTAIEGESLACAFLAPGFALICASRFGWGRALLAGLLAGAAFGMKITVAPMCAVMLVAAAIACGPMQWLALAAGAFVPLVAMVLPYAAIGRVDALLDANLGTITRRFGVPVPHPPLGEILRQQLEAFFPAWIAAFIAPAAWRRESDSRSRRIVVLMVAWLIAALFSVIMVHEFFGYQWTSLMPPAAVIAAWALMRLRASRALAAAVAVVTMLAHVTGQYLMLRTPDSYAVVAAYLYTLPPSQRMSLYVATDDAGLYLLADAPLPTRYPDGAHLYSRDMQAASGSPGQREIERIFAQRPQVVAVDSDIENPAPAKAYLDKTIRQEYRIAFSYENHQVWLRRASLREFSRSSSRP